MQEALPRGPMMGTESIPSMRDPQSLGKTWTWLISPFPKVARGLEVQGRDLWAIDSTGLCCWWDMWRLTQEFALRVTASSQPEWFLAGQRVWQKWVPGAEPWEDQPECLSHKADTSLLPESPWDLTSHRIPSMTPHLKLTSLMLEATWSLGKERQGFLSEQAG